MVGGMVGWWDVGMVGWLDGWRIPPNHSPKGSGRIPPHPSPPPKGRGRTFSLPSPPPPLPPSPQWKMVELLANHTGTIAFRFVIASSIIPVRLIFCLRLVQLIIPVRLVFCLRLIQLIILVRLVCTFWSSGCSDRARKGVIFGKKHH